MAKMIVAGVIAPQELIAIWGRGTTLINETELDRLTHLFYAAVSVNSGVDPIDTGIWVWDDSWTSKSWLTMTTEAAHAHGAKALLSFLGTGGTHIRSLDTIMGNPTLRASLITNLLKFMADYGFDGLDIDWESYEMPLGTHSQKLDVFLRELRARMPAGKLLTIDGGFSGTYNYPDIPVSTVTDGIIDWVNVMAYDLWEQPPAPDPAYHSWYEHVVILVNKWINAGFPRDKLVLGVPFYGKDHTRRPFLYRDIVDTLDPAPDQDLAYGLGTLKGTSGAQEPVVDPLWWNGSDTCRRKAQLVLNERLGGAYYEDLGYDKLHTPYSLATVIEDTLAAAAPIPSQASWTPLAIGAGLILILP